MPACWRAVPRRRCATTHAALDVSLRSSPVSTLWCHRYHRVIALVFRTWFNLPSDIVRPTTRSSKVDRGRHRLREVVMTQTLREASSIDVGCYRAYAGAIGSSPAWQGVLAAAVRVATTEATVFLQGESGTGKEVVARLIHQASPRQHGPFVAINCAALPEQLLESELFGYERGAFTGAQQSKAGQIELASAGVLFLDEVSEMSPAAQAKFLRVLQEREFQRLGGTRPVKANIRVIAASNQDLQRAVADGRFREDLFCRLQVFDIRMPPLRERRSDIPRLIDAFLQEVNRSTGCSSA